VGVDPWVVDIYLCVVGLQGSHDVHHLGVAHVGAVFLEGQAQYQDLAVEHGETFAQHEFDGGVGHMDCHVVVDAPARKDDLWVVAHFLRFVGQVVGVHTDAVAADQAGPEGQKVPLGARRVQHLQGVDPQASKDQTELIHQGDVDVALGVFDDLGGFGHLDAAGFVGAGGNNLGIEGVDRVGDFGGTAAGDFLDAGQTVGFVAGVDALWAVAAIKVAVELEAARAFEFGYADLFGGAGVNGGLVDHQVTGLERSADGLAGLDEGGEVGPVGLIHGGRHGDDEDLAGVQVLLLMAIAQLVSRLQFFCTAFERVVAPSLQLGDPRLVDVEAEHGAVLAELDGQGEANVAQADDGDGGG